MAHGALERREKSHPNVNRSKHLFFRYHGIVRTDGLPERSQNSNPWAGKDIDLKLSRLSNCSFIMSTAVGLDLITYWLAPYVPFLRWFVADVSFGYLEVLVVAGAVWAVALYKFNPCCKLSYRGLRSVLLWIGDVLALTLVVVHVMNDFAFASGTTDLNEIMTVGPLRQAEIYLSVLLPVTKLLVFYGVAQNLFFIFRRKFFN